MKKVKVFGLLLLGSLFGLTSCDAPAFMYKIPGLNKLLPAQQEQEKQELEEQKEEKKDEEAQPSGDEGGNDGGNEGDQDQPSGGDDGGETPVEQVFTDVLTRESTGLKNGASDYTLWTYSPKTSSATYKGRSAATRDSIQLRAKSSDSGIVSTKSGGKIKSVQVSWQSDTQSDRVLQVYGSNTAYSSPEDLFGSNSGTLLGEIAKSGSSTSLEISGSYQYVGVRSKADAMYLSSITFEWLGTASGDQGGDEGGDEGGETQEGSALFNELKEEIYSIACDLFNCEESELIIADDDSSEASQADITYRDTADLVFVSLYGEFDNSTLAETVEYLEYYLPDGYEKDTDLSDESSAYVDNYYDAGELYYSIYVGLDDTSTFFYFDIFPEAHLDAYFEYNE